MQNSTRPKPAYDRQGLAGGSLCASGAQLASGNWEVMILCYRQTLHHNIYIIIIIITVIIATVIIIFTMFLQLGSNFDPEFEVIYKMSVLFFTTTIIIMAAVLLLLF